MKIYIITQNAPVYLGQFLDDFFKHYDDQHSVYRIIVFSPNTNKSIINEIIQRFNFYGFLSFLKMSIFIISNKFKSYFFF